MLHRHLIGTTVLATIAALYIGLATTPAYSAGSKYPDWESVWKNPNINKGDPWDPTKPMGLGQKAPLTPEYQKVFEASLKAQAAGGHGNNYKSLCALNGMPRMMSLYGPMEILIRPKVTDVIFQDALTRRIYTDGRDWPDAASTFEGYSIGKWVDKDGDGRYDELDVETRNFSGPRALESTGLPLANDNETIVKERFFLDKNNHDILHDEITTIDSAFTHPWTVLKAYVRDRTSQWSEYNCKVTDKHVMIGSDEYALGADGKLMPLRPGQAPPDLSYFKKF